MKAIADPSNALGRGLAAIRQQFQIPEVFPDAALSAAEAATSRVPTEHVDRTARGFVTLDPASSTDLDQAFTIERSGADQLLHYAIADVAWFVEDGGPIDREAWRRGTTQYLPDGKAGLYPPVLSEGAASLLPDGPRPAIVFTVRVAEDGAVRLDGAERAIVRSHAKLAYDAAVSADLPEGFAELARRIRHGEQQRGAARINLPAQEIVALPGGGFELRFRPQLETEVCNAALSLATNLAVADLLLANETGLFRVMAEPDERAVQRLRHTADAIGLEWPIGTPLAGFERTLDSNNSKHASFMLAIQRASQGASYEPCRSGEVPWHAAVAATYAHATAPLRRLADRYVVEAALALANGKPVPPAVDDAFGRLGPVMARADALGSQVARAAIDLAETVILQDQEGKTFDAIATEADGRGIRIQLRELPIAARIAADGVKAGDPLQVTLIEADPDRRMLKFEKL
ncbi:MAG TPA: RNB domain-containing ribonuclease [Allosphingosinicella sp.]|jgi:exoribonuclease R|nr:RNB domain-containing ribonuclease [Allosphingosinicella sp.]